jgi:hypothetical protein
MSDIIPIDRLPDEYKAEYLKQIEKRSHYPRERWIAKFLRIKLLIKKIRYEYTKETQQDSDKNKN